MGWIEGEGEGALGQVVLAEGRAGELRSDWGEEEEREQVEGEGVLLAPPVWRGGRFWVCHVPGRAAWMLLVRGG